MTSRGAFGPKIGRDPKIDRSGKRASALRAGGTAPCPRCARACCSEFGSLNLSRECRQLDVSGEQEGQISGGNVNAGNKELEQTAERNNGEAMDWRSRTRERTRGWMR